MMGRLSQIIAYLNIEKHPSDLQRQHYFTGINITPELKALRRKHRAQLRKAMEMIQGGRPTGLEIPCGQTMGHGETCDQEGHMCDQCLYIIELEERISYLEHEFAMTEERFKDATKCSEPNG